MALEKRFEAEDTQSGTRAEAGAREEGEPRHAALEGGAAASQTF